MPHLFTWRGPTPWRIYGPPAGESGPWRCGCPHGQDHMIRPVDPDTGKKGQKPHHCRHLADLWTHAENGDLSGRFDETAAGAAKADACACQGAEEPVRLRRRPKTPIQPQGPVPGQPSRNRPCPCGSGRNFKLCHGSAGPIPDFALPWRPETGPIGGPDEDDVILDRAKQKEKTLSERRIEKKEKREAENRRIDQILEGVRKIDDERKAKAAARRS